MAVTTKMAGKLMDKLLSGSTLNWGTDEVRVSLLTTLGLSAYNQDTITTIQELETAQASWEATGTNVSAGGIALASKSLSYDSTNNYVQVKAGASTWSNSTVTAYGAVVYKYAGGTKTSQFIITVVDFGQAMSSSAGDFTITWDTTDGVCRFQALPTS